MADDHRKDEPYQIIIKRLGNYEMGFLPIEIKLIPIIFCFVFVKIY